MLGHMIFNKLKWFPFSDNTDSIQASGKSFLAVPTKFTIRKGAELSNYATNQGNYYAEEDTDVTCIGRGKDGYFFAGYVNANVQRNLDGVSERQGFSINTLGQGPGFIHSADVKNVIWGG